MCNNHFYTTHTALIQGNSIDSWIKWEFDGINRTVQSIFKLQSKGNNSTQIDKVIQELDFHAELNDLLGLENHEKSPNDSETFVKAVFDDSGSELFTDKTDVNTGDNLHFEKTHQSEKRCEI